MKKLMIAAMTMALTLGMSTAAFADDISVRTSIGSGEVVFTETTEPVDISGKELNERIKGTLKGLNDIDKMNGFLDAQLDATIKLDEQNQLGMKADIVCSLEKYEKSGHANIHYFIDMMGFTDAKDSEMYTWEDNGVKYNAERDRDDNDWDVSASSALDELTGNVTESIENNENAFLSADTLQPFFYEENGKKYYVCIYTKDDIAKASEAIDGGNTASMIDGIAGEDAKLIIVVDAETGMPRAISADLSNAAGTFPGEMFGMETPVELTCNDCYFTVLADNDVNPVEIPEDVLNTPVDDDDDDDNDDADDIFDKDDADDSDDIDLDDILGRLGQ